MSKRSNSPKSPKPTPKSERPSGGVRGQVPKLQNPPPPPPKK